MKWVLYILLGLLSLIVVALLIVRWQPSLVVGVANAVQSEFVITADNLAVTLWPAGLSTSALKVEGSGVNISGEAVSAQADWSRIFNDEPFWHVEAKSLEILPGAGPAATPAPTAEETGPPAPLDITPFLSFTHVTIDTLRAADEALAIRATRDNEFVNLTVRNESTEQPIDVTAQLTPVSPHRINATVVAGEITSTISGILQTNPTLQLTIESGDVASKSASPFEVSSLSGKLATNAAYTKLTVDSLRGEFSSAQIPSESFDVSVDARSIDTSPRIEVDAKTSSVALAGNVDINAEQHVAFDVNLSGESWPDYLSLPLYSAEQIAPFSLKTKGSWADAKLTVDAFSAQTPSHDVQANASVDTAEGLLVVADIDAERLYVPLTGQSTEGQNEQTAEAQQEDSPAPEPVADTGEVTVETEPKNKSDLLLSKDAIDWSWLDTLEMDVTLDAKTLQLQEAEFDNFAVHAKADEGVIDVTPISGALGDGGFSGALALRRVDDGVNLQTQFDLQGVPLEAFRFVPQEELTGGESELSLKLSTVGVSLHELGKNANGHVYVMVEDATLQNDLIEVVGSDLILEALSKLNPFMKEDPSTQLGCALASFEVNDGVMKSDDRLAVETEKMVINGNGTVNLDTEKIKFSFSPTAKSGIGINAGSLVAFLGVGGTLAKPGLSLDAAGALKTGATVGAALSTGGVSLVAEGLLKRAVAGKSACLKFRESGKEDSTPEADAEPDADTVTEPEAQTAPVAGSD